MLLEAGSPVTFLGVTARVRGFTVAKYKPELRQRADFAVESGGSAELYEALAPGGLSNHWSCAVPRFSAEDFADAARAGEVYTWPLGYEDLAPFYDRMEQLLCVAGPAASSVQLPAPTTRDHLELGRDWQALAVNAEKLDRTLVAMPYAYGAESTLSLSGTAFNAYTRLIRPLERKQRVKVRYDARALRLEWSGSTRRVEAVVVHDRKTGREERIPCSAVVLAAGAVNTAQVLLESSSADFPDGLGNTHDVLGRYFHDHPIGKLIVDLRAPISVSPAVYLTRDKLARAKPLYAAACMQWSGASALARSILGGHPGRLPYVGFSVFGTMAPAAEDRMKLDRSRPQVAGASPLTLSVRHPPEARVVLEQARDELLSLLEGAGFQPRVRIWKIEAFGSSVHYGGTCRMHASPRFGMLDGFSRLHAVKNVVVADSAAFTTGPEKNPVLTAMALAARGAERLSTELRAGDL